MAEWEDELERWLKPFLDRLGHKTRQRMCPLYVAGLIGPGDRKSVQPMAERLATGNYDQPHHCRWCLGRDTAGIRTAQAGGPACMRRLLAKQQTARHWCR
jgi:DDE superfamily endonuclease